MSNKIILIVGESGSGKDTLVNAVCKKYGYTKVKSYTTRPQRKDFKDKQSHIFVTDEEFDNLKNLVAYTEFNGFKYCATAEQVEQADFYIIDCEGIKYFKEHYKGNKEIVAVHISCPEVDRFLRMKGRESIEKALERIKWDKHAFKEVSKLTNITIDNPNTADRKNEAGVEMLHNIVEGEVLLNESD